LRGSLQEPSFILHTFYKAPSDPYFECCRDTRACVELRYRADVSYAQYDLADDKNMR
jgi:hypothetical protein